MPAAPGLLPRSSQLCVIAPRQVFRRLGSWIAVVPGLVFAGAGMAGQAGAQTAALLPSWTQQQPGSSPAGRVLPGAAYDPAIGQVVIFGGTADVNNTGVLEADTWTWNGSTWTNVTPPSPANSPSAREAASMAWDAASGQLVLFGGAGLNSNGDLVLNNDTWAWNGSAWTNVTPSAGNPPVRYGASMAFDAAQGLIVLFGGQGLNGVELDDTWTWNGSAWSNVTPASPVNSPSARDEAALAYDAAAGQLVLFGGEPGDTSDTWIWNGTTWAQQSTSPVPGRAGAGMDYDTATEQLVMYSGEGGDSVLGDIWTWNGANWTEQTPVNNPPPSLAGAFAYDVQTGQLVLFGGEVPSEPQDEIPATTWTLQLGSESFSTANVCPGGTGPSPCNQSATLTFVFTAADSGISPSVVTQAATGLDFTDAGGGSCDINGTSHGYNIGDTCTVNVQFAPTLSHARNGGVVLKDATGIAGMAYVTGTGTGPQIAFTPPTISTLGGGFKGPEGVAVDGAGNVYVINLNPATVYEMPPNCTSSSCLTSLGDLSSRPLNVAVDGAGTLYAPGYDGGVLETPYGCTSCATTLGAGDFTALSGVTVDGAGNLYVADAGAGDVYEIPPGCTSLSCFISLGGGFDGPQGVAVDASGNVYVVDYGHNAVKEIPPGCTAAAYTVGSCTTTTLGGGFSGLNDLAVDGSGNVYVADTGNDAVKEIPPGCTSSSCVTTLASGFSDLIGVAADGSGNVYVTNNAGVGSAPYNVTAVYKLSVSTPPTLTFPTATDVGVLDSTDGPLGFTVENIGNAPLSFAVPSSGSNPSVAAGFVWDDASSCTQVLASAAAFSLAPAGSCSVQIEFQPAATGANMGSVALTDNSLNATAATQSAALSGTGQSPGTGTAISCAGCAPNPPYGTSLIFTAVVSPTAGSVTPTGSIGFSVDSGAPVAGTAASCPGGSAADSVCATFTTSTLTATSHTVEAIFTASGSFEGSNASTMVTVTPAPTKVLATSPLTASAVDYKQTLASSTLSGGTVVSSITGATVTGTWSFVNPLTTVLTVTGPQPVVFTPSAASNGNYLAPTSPTTVTVTVTPAPIASTTPAPGTTIGFGTLYLGQIVTKTVTIADTGNAAMAISSPLIAIVKGGNSSEFITVNLCPKSLAAGKSCTMTVTFLAGPFYNPQTATLTISDNAAGSPQSFPLTATVIDPVPQFSATSLNFGTVSTKSTTGVSKPITITNAGATNLTFGALAVSGAGFSKTADRCSGTTLIPKATCTITVTFKPTAKCAATGSLVVPDNALVNSQTISLSGTGD